MNRTQRIKNRTKIKENKKYIVQNKFLQIKDLEKRKQNTINIENLEFNKLKKVTKIMVVIKSGL